jgi:hypothetical protein
MATRHAASRISGPLVSALEATWPSIVRRHPEVPPAVVVVASGTDGRKATEARWGHFAALRWVKGEAQLPEVLVVGEGHVRGAEPVLATLLHEAAHGLAHVREVNDTSRQGRYHNRRYKALAEELGLEVTEVGAIGWSSTTLRESTIQTYRRELEKLQAALTLSRRAEPTAGGTRSKSTNLVPCDCACPRRIRVARSTLDAGPILCGICEHEFAADQTQH